MNERIQKLIEQALVEVRVSIDPPTLKEYPDPNGPHTKIEFSAEKFAELLGKELANHIAGQLPNERLDDWHEGYHAGVQRSIDCLKHFGVEL